MTNGALLAATHRPASPPVARGPRVAVHLGPQAGGPATPELDDLASWLGRRGLVDLLPADRRTAAAYVVELGVVGTGEDGEEQLRLRVLSRAGQVLMAFRIPRAEGAVEKGGERLSRWLGSRPWRSSVASLDAGRIVIHGGRLHRLEPGLELRVLAHRPVYAGDGRRLGEVSTPIGRLRLTEVDARFSVAEVLGDGDAPAVGDEVELAQTAP